MREGNSPNCRDSVFLVLLPVAIHYDWPGFCIGVITYKLRCMNIRSQDVMCNNPTRNVYVDN